MIEFTDHHLLEYPWDETPIREFKPDAPTAGVVVCARRPSGAKDVPDSLGELGCTRVLFVTEDAAGLLPRPIVRHSPTGFEWGYLGSGPADLAANILALFLALKEAWRLHQRFKHDFVARIPQPGGEILVVDIRRWIDAQWTEEQADRSLMADERNRREDAAEIKRLEAQAAAADQDLDDHPDPMPDTLAI